MKPFIYCLAFVTFGVGGVNSAKAGLTIISTFFASAQAGSPITWTGTSFYTTDETHILEYDLNGNLLSSFATPGNPGHDRGLAFDGTNLWLFNRFVRTNDPVPSTFFKLDRSGNVLSSFIAPNNQFGEPINARGLAWNGTNLFANTGRTIDEINTNGNVLGSSLIPGISGSGTTGLGFDGTSFLLTDFSFFSGSGGLLRVDAATQQITGAIETGNNSFVGFAHLSGNRWLLHQNVAGGGKFVVADITFDPFTPPSTAVIPEPTTLALFGFGALGLFGFLRKRKKH